MTPDYPPYPSTADATAAGRRMRRGFDAYTEDGTHASAAYAAERAEALPTLDAWFKREWEKHVERFHAGSECIGDLSDGRVLWQRKVAECREWFRQFREDEMKREQEVSNGV